MRYRCSVLLFWAIVVIPFCCKAQKEAIVCPFGAHNILDMNFQPPLLSVGGATNTWSETGAICSSNGTLMFYSDGNTVWDGNHKPLPNGQINPASDPFYKNNLFVPVGTGKQRYYYLFTMSPPYEQSYYYACGNQTQTDTTLYYSVIDLSLNGGKGDVVQGMKKVPLLTSAGVYLSATLHADGLDAWVITQDATTREIYAYLVGGCGISGPVISPMPPAYDRLDKKNTGFLWRVSPNGKKGLFYNNIDTALAGELDFDNSTGRFTNPTLFSSEISNYIGGQSTYTPDSKSIVSTDFKNTYVINRHPNGYSYDIVQNDSVIDPISYTFPGNNIFALTYGSYLYRVQFTDSSDITYVPYPTNKSLYNCNVSSNTGLYVYANELCNFVQSYADPNYHSPVTRIPSLDSPFRVCQQAPLSITFKQAANAKQLSWDFGDGSPTLVTLSLSDTTQTHNYLRAGKYTITAIASYGCLSDTSKATVTVDSLPVVSLPLDSLVDVCKPLVLDAGAGFANYRWQDGDTSETHTVSGPGKYSVTVTNACGRATGSLTIKKADVVAPNVFTPNNDGANEYFWLPNMDVLDRKLTVLNRYGEQVYTSQHYHNEWKAEGVPDGMYYYFFTYPGCDTAKGYVQVIR